MAVKRQPSSAATQRTIAALVTKKTGAEAISDTSRVAEYQAEIERIERAKL